jgi:hypothetical protein
MVWQSMTVYGNHMTMWIRKYTSLGLAGTLCLICLWGCLPRLAPAVPPGITLTPGRYLTAYYRGPDFNPVQATYLLETFPVATAQDFSAQDFQTLFMQELAQAWRDNGLKISAAGNTTVSGTIQYVAIRGAAVRRLTGKIDAGLVVSGAITRGSEVLFAFQDRLCLSSPVNPGPPAPQEDVLLLRQAARTFATHLLNELLLYWPAEEAK